MSHIVIILDWQNRINQLETLSDTLHDNIENNQYHGQQLTQANALMSATETEMAAIDAHAGSFDDHVKDLENFLGI